MRAISIIAVAALVSVGTPSFAAAQGMGRTGEYMTRTSKSGQSMVLRIPRTRAECLANRRALGHKKGGGRCDRLFPR